MTQISQVPHATVRVDLDAIMHNVRVLHERSRTAQFMAIVKGDAYGHGLVPVARASRAAGADWLATATYSEALELRAAGLDGPILAWLAAPGEDYRRILAADIDVAAYSVAELAEITAAAAELGVRARVHLKIDTGLARGGATEADWPGLVRATLEATDAGTVEPIGIWTHFANADAPHDPVTTGQLAVFDRAVATAAAHGLRVPVRHTANSAATLVLPEAHYEAVRPGLALYGLSPVPDIASPADFGLRPAMSLRAKVALTKRVPAGQGVSYGHTYHTPRETTLGLVPLGYADGIPRHASNRGPVFFPGAVAAAGSAGAVAARRTVAGRVCMDQFVVDLDGLDVGPGDEVILFGDGTVGDPTAQDWAVAADTISYEVVTRLSARLPREYVGGPAAGAGASDGPTEGV